MGEVTETGGKKKLSNIRAPMEGGKLMCEVELEDGLVRLDRLGSAPEDGEVGEVVRQVRLESAPEDGEVGEVVRQVRLESAPEREVGPGAGEVVRGSAPGRPEVRGSGRGANRAGRRVSA